MSNSNSNGIDISDSKSGSISDGDKVKIGNSLTNGNLLTYAFSIIINNII